jgi:hypothetical protein
MFSLKNNENIPIEKMSPRWSKELLSMEKSVSDRKQRVVLVKEK